MNPSTVEELSKSIEKVGLINRIQVTIDDDHATLVAGAHRVEALKSLGYEGTDADVVSQEDALLIEIDENLVREDLNAPDRAVLLSRKRDILIGQDDRPPVKNHRGRPPEAGSVRDVAKSTGLAREVVRESLSAWDKLSEAVREALTGEDIPQHHITELSHLTPEEQLQALHRYHQGETLLDAVRFIRGGTAEEEDRLKELKALNRAWQKARPAVQETFLKENALERRTA